VSQRSSGRFGKKVLLVPRTETQYVCCPRRCLFAVTEELKKREGAWIWSIAYENQETSDVNKPLCVTPQMYHGPHTDETVFPGGKAAGAWC
jgi:hypothetical protein